MNYDNVPMASTDHVAWLASCSVIVCLPFGSPSTLNCVRNDPSLGIVGMFSANSMPSTIAFTRTVPSDGPNTSSPVPMNVCVSEDPGSFVVEMERI